MAKAKGLKRFASGALVVALWPCVFAGLPEHGSRSMLFDVSVMARAYAVIAFWLYTVCKWKT